MDRLRAALLALGLVACDVGAPALPRSSEPREIESGGRLRARKWIVGTHEIFRDFVDRLTGEACTFEKNVGPGPTYRCLPSSAALHSEGQGPFLDASCTIPAGIVLETASAYVVVEPRNACTTERAIYRAGPVQRSKTYALDGNACVPLSTLAVPVQKLESAIPASAFVRAVPEIERGTGRIVRLSLVAEDGARQPFEAFDRVRNEVVTLDRGTLAVQWRPSRVAFIGAGAPQYVDDACTVQAATKVGRDAACPITAVLVFEGICGKYAVHSVARAVTPKSKVESFCQETPSRSLAFAVGAKLAEGALAPARRVEVDRDGMKRRGFVGPDDEAVVLWSDVLAPVSGEPCTVIRAADGVQRCLPTYSASAGQFVDAECTQPAVRVASTGCENEESPRYVRIDQGVYRVEARAERVYSIDGGKCRAATLASTEQVYAVSEVDIAQFPMAKEE